MGTLHLLEGCFDASPGMRLLGIALLFEGDRLLCGLRKRLRAVGFFQLTNSWISVISMTSLRIV